MHLALGIINSRFMLDALSNWVKEDSKKATLDEHLWNTLRDHISAHYSVYPIDHIQSLLSTFRNQENDRLVSQQNQCRRILEVCLQHMANTYFEWWHSTPMIRRDKVLQVQHWR